MSTALRAVCPWRLRRRAVHGVDETQSVSFAHQNAPRSGDGRESRPFRAIDYRSLHAGTPRFSTDRADGSHTCSADPRRPATEGVGPRSTHVCGAREVRVMGCSREGVNHAGGYAASQDRHGGSHVEKPRGSDSVADGSPRDRATGRPQKSKISDGLHESSALVNVPERGSRPVPPTSGKPVLKPTGPKPGSLCAGKSRRCRATPDCLRERSSLSVYGAEDVTERFLREVPRGQVVRETSSLVSCSRASLARRVVGRCPTLITEDCVFGTTPRLPRFGSAPHPQANLIPLDLPEMGRLELTPERSVRP